MKYGLELEEAEARALVYDLSNDGSDLEKSVAEQLAAQLPPPTPTKIGAVVRTEYGTFLRADGSTTPWIRPASKAPFSERPNWLSDADLGRIIEVMAPGVDL